MEEGTKLITEEDRPIDLPTPPHGYCLALAAKTNYRKSENNLQQIVHTKE